MIPIARGFHLPEIAGSSSFLNSLSYLRSLGVIDYPFPGAVSATPLLWVDEA